MSAYYLESIIYETAQGIRELIEKNIIADNKRIYLYGLDTYSFAMKTILENYGFKTAGYIADDMELIMTHKRRAKAAFRYLNSNRDRIDIFAIEEKLIPFDSSMMILSASKDCPITRITDLNYRQNTHFFQVLDWEQNRFSEKMRDKKRMEIGEVQNVAKEILRQVDAFCLANDIRYWVCGGTLLGTIRHKGFIPWDDDIDIFMPWDDYRRFIREFQDKGKYSLISPENVDRGSFYGLFSKIFDDRTMVMEKEPIVRFVHPVAVDVFPLIGMPEEKAERHRFFQRYNELMRQITEDFYLRNGDYGVYNRWYSAQEEFLKEYDFDRSDFVGVLGTGYGERDWTSRSVYDVTKRLSFEDIEVNVPAGYQEYLDNLYGKDWMELPPEEKRKSHHEMEAYWL